MSMGLNVSDLKLEVFDVFVFIWIRSVTCGSDIIKCNYNFIWYMNNIIDQGGHYILI